jgi:diguanylate cyclase
MNNADLGRRLLLALEASGIGIWEHNATTGEIVWDDRLRALYGLEPGDAPAWIEFVHPDDRMRAEADFTEALERRSDYSSRFRIVPRTGGIRHIRSRAHFHQSDNGDALMIGAEWDVTEDVQREEELRRRTLELEALRREAERAASHDYLTQLPNRRALQSFINASAASPATRAALHIDLDGFKSINDQHGHEAGDEHLREFAQGMQNMLPPGAFAARLGGDEFLVLLRSASIESATLLASSLIMLAASLSDRLEPPAGAASIGVSIGQSDWVRHIQVSDAALYAAKHAGRGRYVVRIEDASLQLNHSL